MQAKLPDINAALVRHRNAVMNAYDGKDFDKAAISFEAIISLLPDDYKVEINSDKYEALTKSKRTIKCDICTESFERNTIESFEMELSNLDSLILCTKKAVVWECPHCQNVRPIQSSEKSITMFERPFYLGVIPDKPERIGMHDRIGYRSRCKKWYEICFREIEHKIGLYRTDYAKQDDADVEVNDEDV